MKMVVDEVKEKKRNKKGKTGQSKEPQGSLTTEARQGLAQ
jgi:hypothetical protein